jgi:HD-GYP domain-containing protein (c-di-GMP phosphodiesterase class II)
MIEAPTPDFNAAQEALEKTLETARAGEDKELAGKVREVGERLGKRLMGCIRLFQIHDKGNDAFNQPMQELEDVLTELSGLLGAIHVVMVENQVYVNDIRVRFDPRNDQGMDLNETFNRHLIGGISFHQVPTNLQLRKLLEKIAGSEAVDDHPRRGLVSWLENAGMNFVELQPVYRFRMHGEERKRQDKEFQKVYNSSTFKVSETWSNMEAGRHPNPVALRRLITDFIDLTDGQESEELMTATIDDRAPPHVRHTLHVTALVLLIGKELKLPEADLADLGVSAMYHDMGYTEKEDGFSPPFERHGSCGARVLLRQRGFHEAKIYRLLCCLQHHRDFDDPRTPSLFARILRVADDYDTLTRPRREGPLMVPPDAIAHMWAQAGSYYDPLILQVFINRLGRYPPGSILELMDGRWAVVLSSNRGVGLFDKPIVRVAREADGSEVLEFQIMDLSYEGQVKDIVRPKAIVDGGEDEDSWDSGDYAEFDDSVDEPGLGPDDDDPFAKPTVYRVPRAPQRDLASGSDDDDKDPFDGGWGDDDSEASADFSFS